MNSLKLIQKSMLNSHFRISTHFLRNASDGILDPEPNQDVTIPKPKERPGESVDEKKSRLMYQSRKRGMLENDLLLSTFASKHLNGFSEAQLVEYDKLINGPSNDWDIFYWATENKATPEEYEKLEVMKMLKLHCKNLNREKRLRQPDLA